MRCLASTSLRLVLLAALSMTCANLHAQQEASAEMAPVGEGDAEVVRLLNTALEKHGMPALGALVVDSDGIVAIGVSGVRKAGTDIPVTLQDKWHLGSNTKAMTATLLGMLVEEGKLEWESPLSEIFPEFDKMNPAFRSVTVSQLTTHRAGLISNLPWGLAGAGDSLSQARHDTLRLALMMEPTYSPGKTVTYSNTGYVVAGAIVEKIHGAAWETVIQRELFDPLGMTSAGFGGTGTLGEIDQPWPHESDGSPAPTNGPKMDNPAILGPAGTVHCSLGDYGKFLSEHLRAGEGPDALLKAETFVTLHTPPFGDEYAMGWVVLDRSWGGGKVLTHGGSNTLNYVIVWMAPQKDRAVVVATNQGGPAMSAATDEVVGQLIRRYVQPAE